MEQSIASELVQHSAHPLGLSTEEFAKIAVDHFSSWYVLTTVGRPLPPAALRCAFGGVDAVFALPLKVMVGPFDSAGSDFPHGARTGSDLGRILKCSLAAVGHGRVGCFSSGGRGHRSLWLSFAPGFQIYNFLLSPRRGTPLFFSCHRVFFLLGLCNDSR